MSSVTIIGSGGNIGSHLAPHLARMTGVKQIRLVDRDRYDASNLSSQSIETADVGASKVAVQAARLQRINPGLELVSLHRAVEDVPLGALRADVMLSCVDSRRARLAVNQAAWRLGVPWIDAGVQADGRLVRVQAFVPGRGTPCMECDWEPEDYSLVEQEYPCDPGSATPAHATGAPSSLGALAAALQASECEKLLRDERDLMLVGRELLIDARNHAHFLTRCEHNSACRMPDHAGWVVNGSMSATPKSTMTNLLAACRSLAGSRDLLEVGVAGQQFVRSLTCPACGRSQPTLRLERALRDEPAACQRCRAPMTAAAFDHHDTLAMRAIPTAMRAWKLSDLGVQTGDILSFVTASVTERCEVRPA